MVRASIIYRSFVNFQFLGIPVPRAMQDEGDLEAAARLWAQVIPPGVTEEEFTRAVGLFLDPSRGQGERKFWPQPGQLLKLVGRRGVIAEVAWGRVLEASKWQRDARDARRVVLRPGEAPRGEWTLHSDPWTARRLRRAVEDAGTGSAEVGWARLQPHLGDPELRSRFISWQERRCIDLPRRHHETDEQWAATVEAATRRAREVAEHDWEVLAKAAKEHPAHSPPSDIEVEYRRLAKDADVERWIWRGIEAIGGWSALRSLPEDAKEQHFIALRFAKAYNAPPPPGVFADDPLEAPRSVAVDNAPSALEDRAMAPPMDGRAVLQAGEPAR